MVREIPFDRIRILPELEAFLMPLSTDEQIILTESIKESGVSVPLALWEHSGEYFIVDGHHRYRSCEQLNITKIPPSRIHEFDNVAEAKQWMSTNQRGRRNISDFRKLELERIAMEMSETDIPKSREHLVAVTGFSSGTIGTADYVIKHASEDIKDLARSGAISIHQAYQRVRKKETPQNYNDKEKVINQIPCLFKADVRLLSILYYFEKNKDREDNPSHMLLAKEWREHYGLTEENLPTDTIVKSYIRLRDSIRKEKAKIQKHL